MDKQTNQQKTIPAQSGSGTSSSTTTNQASEPAPSSSPLKRWQDQNVDEEPWNPLGEKVRMEKKEKKELIKQTDSKTWSTIAEQGSQN